MSVFFGSYYCTFKLICSIQIFHIGEILCYRYALVSKHLNSSMVDAKFSKHVEKGLELGMDPRMAGSYMDVKEQLTYKYVISIEGNLMVVNLMLWSFLLALANGLFFRYSFKVMTSLLG